MSQFSADELFRLDEIDRLRAENDDLKAALDVWNSSELGLMIAKLRADSINLKTAYGELYNADALIAKLRAALLPYAERAIESEDGGKIARAALANEQKP